MLFPFYISLLFITIAQAAPRPLGNALHIRNPADDSEIIATNFDFDPEKTETSDTIETAEAIEPTETTETTTDANGQQNYGTYTTGNEETTTNPEKLVSLVTDGTGNPETDDPDELLASAHTQPHTAPTEGVGAPGGDRKSPSDIHAPGDNAQPSNPQNYGPGQAVCKKKSGLPWNDTGCKIVFPRSPFSTPGVVKCQQHGSRAQCVVCAVQSTKLCRPYSTITLPTGVKIPKKILIPADQKLY